MTAHETPMISGEQESPLTFSPEQPASKLSSGFWLTRLEGPADGPLAGVLRTADLVAVDVGFGVVGGATSSFATLLREDVAEGRLGVFGWGTVLEGVTTVAGSCGGSFAGCDVVKEGPSTAFDNALESAGACASG